MSARLSLFLAVASVVMLVWLMLVVLIAFAVVYEIENYGYGHVALVTIGCVAGLVVLFLRHRRGQ